MLVLGFGVCVCGWGLVGIRAGVWVTAVNLSVAAAHDAMEEAQRPVVAMQLDVGSWLVSEWFV